MKISKDKRVTFKFVLKDETGKIVDASQDEPTVYLHGHQQILPLLEQALEGKSETDFVSVFIPFEQAYGKHSPYLVRKVLRKHFAQADLQIGMKVYSPDNERFVMTVTEIGDEFITLDANHPLAGISLIFEIEILNVQDPTSAS